MKAETHYDGYYLSYTGLGLPLRLVNPLEPEEVQNRNTFYGAQFDSEGRTSLIHKVVYGEIDTVHRYGYNQAGDLLWAEITQADEETQRLTFDPA